MDNREGGDLNHEWPRMGTNKATRAFQPEICAAGAVRTGGFAGCLAHAKPRRETHKFSVRFSVGGIQFSVFVQASRGRESAGAGPGRWSHAEPRRQMRCHGCFFRHG
jgi:hypothetical protein